MALEIKSGERNLKAPGAITARARLRAIQKAPAIDYDKLADAVAGKLPPSEPQPAQPGILDLADTAATLYSMYRNGGRNLETPSGQSSEGHTVAVLSPDQQKILAEAEEKRSFVREQVEQRYNDQAKPHVAFNRNTKQYEVLWCESNPDWNELGAKGYEQRNTNTTKTLQEEADRLESTRRLYYVVKVTDNGKKVYGYQSLMEDQSPRDGFTLDFGDDKVRKYEEAYQRSQEELAEMHARLLESHDLAPVSSDPNLIAVEATLHDANVTMKVTPNGNGYKRKPTSARGRVEQWMDSIKPWNTHTAKAVERAKILHQQVNPEVRASGVEEIPFGVSTLRRWRNKIHTFTTFPLGEVTLSAIWLGAALGIDLPWTIGRKFLGEPLLRLGHNIEQAIASLALDVATRPEMAPLTHQLMQQRGTLPTSDVLPLLDEEERAAVDEYSDRRRTALVVVDASQAPVGSTNGNGVHA